MKIVFLGSPPDAVPPLTALVAAGHEIALVVTQPDRRRGRGELESPSAVKRAATELGLPVVTPDRSRDALADLAASGATLGVVVAYGQILRPDFLAALPEGFVNLHFSLLPRWRGAAPVERAILAGDEETGVCLMRVEEGLDTGGVYASARLTIGADETAGELRARLVELATGLLVQHLPDVPGAVPEPQVGEPTYADKLTVEEFEIDATRTAIDLHRLVRAGNPRPGAWCTVGGRRVKVWKARPDDGPVPEAAGPGTLTKNGALAVADGLLDLLEVQPEGKRSMSGAALVAGLARDARRLDPR
ncbi:MAG: methionyl-tRNA formyltransferase [Actinomycetota bacterium]|jgi:methionyl-tRNA formyltransferase|nr:methionyl-tRNA formyltransferase [Actinomycetota bacterium]